MNSENEFSGLYERRSQLIQVESFLLITALLTQLGFVFWMGFGTPSMNAVHEFLDEPLLWILLGANLFCWMFVFATRFFWQAFEGGADQDKKTGLYHRGYFERIVEMEIRRSRRYKYPAALCLLDLDRFSALNKTAGRKRADEILRIFADFLRQSVRTTDLIARFGRDEFCVLLPHTDAVRAEKFISRIVALAQERLDCSFSAGLTPFHAGENRERLFERAAAALEQAKQGGSGRVVCIHAEVNSQAAIMTPSR